MARKVFESIAHRYNLLGLLASTLALLRGRKRCILSSFGRQARVGFGFIMLSVAAIFTGELCLRTKVRVISVDVGLRVETNLNS